MNQRIIKDSLTCLSLLGLLVLSGCGSSDDKTPEMTGTFSETSKTKIDSFAAIPDVGSLMITDDSGSLHLQPNSSDAVVGTPPAFASINKDNAEEFLVPNIASLKTNLRSAADSQNWDSFQTYIDSFREGQAKCSVMQDAARQISELTSAAGSSCYMKRVDAETGTRLITHVSGDEVAQGEFFTPAAKTVYRALNLTNMQNYDDPSEDDAQEPDQNKSETIIFEIQGSGVEPGVYQVSLNFCQGTTAIRSKEVIRVDNNEGVLTYTSTQDDKWGKGLIKLSAGLLADANGKVSFDPASSRVMQQAHSYAMTDYTHKSNGYVGIANSTITTKYFSQGTGKHDETSYSYSDKNAGVVRYSGNSANDIKIYEAAGRIVNTYSQSEESFSNENSIVFEFNENESPKYTTITTSELKTSLDAIDFAADPILSQETPVIDLPAVDASICGQAVSATYELDMQHEGMTAVAEACDSDFGEDSAETCHNLRKAESELYDAIQAHEASKD